MDPLVLRLVIDKFLYLKETQSTNEHATKLSSISSPNHNFCIYTYNQSDGKGQIGRKWYTGQGDNLAASYVINNVNLKVKDHFCLNMAVSVAIYRLISSYISSKKCTIKWPNDIYVEDKKLAGILIQNQIKGNTISKSVIGIGINVNTKNFPVEIPNPTSILKCNHGGSPISLFEVLEKLTEELTQNLGSIKLFNEKIKAEYLRNLFRINEVNYYKSNGKTFEGKILDVADDGQLKMDTKEGIQSFSFREISFENLI